MNVAARLNQWRNFLTDDQSAAAINLALARVSFKLFSEQRFKIYRMLARLIEADVDARSALEFIYDVQSQDGRKPDNLQAIAVRQWLDAHREHGRLSEALQGWAPPSEILLIEAGERSGRFREALDIMIRLNGKMAAIRTSIISKLAYPVIVSIAITAVIYYLAVSFMPQILALNGSDTPWLGSAASAVSFFDWAANWLIPTAVGIVGAIVTVFATLPIFRGRARVFLDRLPPWSVHRFVTGTGFLSAVLILMASGKSLVDAIALTRHNASPYLQIKIDRIAATMREGEDFGAALLASGENFPDLELIKEIQLYTRIGRLDEGLVSVVETWMADATTRVTRQIGILANCTLLAAAMLLAFVFNGFYAIINQVSQG